jgi:hypothetical protein
VERLLASVRRRRAVSKPRRCPSANAWRCELQAGGERT